MNGYLYFSKNKFATAKNKLQKCYDLNDTSIFVTKYLGYSLFKINEYDLAKKHLEITCKNELNNIDAHYMAGLAYARTDDPNLGVYYLEIALDLLTVDSLFMSRFYADLGNAHTKNYQYKQAIKDYENALIYNHTDAAIYYEMGILYDHNLKNRKKALEYYKKFTKSIPEKTPEDTQIHFTILKEYLEQRIQKLEEDNFMEKK
jgi:tetratricopeptide (TPR) repeat protein